jgi:hypothetical protein
MASTTSARFDGLELWPAHVSARGNEVSVAAKREVLKTFSNVYTMGEIIGEGGSGRVYRATDDGGGARAGAAIGFFIGSVDSERTTRQAAYCAASLKLRALAGLSRPPSTSTLTIST